LLLSASAAEMSGGRMRIIVGGGWAGFAQRVRPVVFVGCAKEQGEKLLVCRARASLVCKGTVWTIAGPLPVL